AVLAEGFPQIGLAEGLAEQPVGNLHAAFPARVQLLGPAQKLSIEAEVFIDKGLRKKRRGSAYRVPAKISLPVGERNGINSRVDFLEEIRRHHVHFSKGRPSSGGKKTGKLEVRR